MQPPGKQVVVHALAHKYPGIARVITSPVDVYNTQTQAKESTHGIWDTGATGTVITKHLADKLGLVPIGQTRVNGVHGMKDDVNLFAIKIVLNNQNVSFTLPVTECAQLVADNSAGILIGMDIISKGDFAISNFNGQTIMSFRTPSIQHMDLGQGMHQPVQNARPLSRQERRAQERADQKRKK